MTPREEFQAAIEQLEDLVGKLGLLVLCFRRLGQDPGLKEEVSADSQETSGVR
jgi:hypothetical protein